jgi:hypothetical protein
MKEKHAKRIDKLLGDLGLHPQAVDPDEMSVELDPLFPARHAPTTGLCGKTCYVSETSARKCAKLIKKRGANTSFLRPYFCPQCKAWHITSRKNHTPGSSTVPKRNAGRKRRNHAPTQPDDDP